MNPSQTIPTKIKALALVTGASSGIGKAIAQRLARDGYHVLVHYHRGESAALTVLDHILQNGGSGQILQFDVQDSGAIETALEPFKDVQILVNNAGIHDDALTGMLSDEAFASVLQTNTFGAFYLMRFCSRQMLRRRLGCIVNVASLAGQTGNQGQINYSASKAALIAMTKTLAIETGTRGIRVNAVAPGLISTGMVESIPQKDELISRIPLRRMGTPDEVAGVVSFLCSADASYITGQTLNINGGYYAP